MDSTKSLESQYRREDLPSILRTAWRKRHGVHGDFPQPWPLVHHTAIIRGKESWTAQRLPSEMHDSISTQTNKWFSFMMECQLIGTRRTLGLTRSWRCCHNTAPFWTSLSKQSVVWRRPSTQILRGLMYKREWTTGKKQETVGLRWASSTHSYFCKRCSVVSALSLLQNALAGLNLCRLLCRAGLMMKNLRAEKPQARTSQSLFF